VRIRETKLPVLKRNSIFKTKRIMIKFRETKRNSNLSKIPLKMPKFENFLKF